MRLIFGQSFVRRLLHLGVPKYSSPYKSQYCLENLYPNTANSSSTEFQVPKSDRTFSGFIPIESVQITTCRSSGPGGQNVNKVNSKVEIRFHVETAAWIPDPLKSKLLQTEASNITKNGYLVVKSEKTRSQMLNQADCLDKIRSMIRGCDVKLYTPSEEDLNVIRQRQNRARAAMLREKKSHSLTKQSRQAPSSNDI